MVRMCHYYKHRKICTYDKNCGEQLPSNKYICTSNLYYSMGLEKECENLEARVRELEEKLQIAEEHLDVIARGYHFGDDIEKHLKLLEQEALQKMEEVKNVNIQS